MEKQRKITAAILLMLVILSVLSIVQISMKIDERKGKALSLGGTHFGAGVAIVRIDGAIQMIGEGGPLGGPKGAESIIDKLDELEQDSSIKAIVLRINSPGGTVAATQEIYQKLMKMRKKGIIIVASMGEIAASGGYYVAAACNYIVANFGTITGSIGVIAVSPNLKGLFKKLGIEMNVIKSGKYKDILSSHRDVTRNERIMLQQMIDASYNRFVKDVSAGRDLEQADIRKIADGRILGGETALKYKLIDQIGTFRDSIAKAKELAKLPADAPVYRKKSSPFEQVLEGLGNIFRGKDLYNETLGSHNGYLEYRYMP